MLISSGEIRGYAISALDGNIGHVKDFYFDDFNWNIRYMVVDTGTWLPGRKVLIAPQAIGQPDWGLHVVPVRLTREKIEGSPSITEDEPVSRQKEKDLMEYYGWASYWPVTIGAPPWPAGSTVEGDESRKDSNGDPNLRSVNAVSGYQVWSPNEKAGHIEDFIIGTDDWTMKCLVVGTRDWLPGKKVLLVAHEIESISWSDRKVTATVPAEQIKNRPEFDESASFDSDYAARLRTFYETQPRARLEAVTGKAREGISAGIEKVTVKSKEMVEVAKLRRALGKLRKEKEEAIAQLGEFVYSMYSEDAIEVQKIKDECRVIAEMDDRIQEEEEQLTTVRSGLDSDKSD